MCQWFVTGQRKKHISAVFNEYFNQIQACGGFNEFDQRRHEGKTLPPTSNCFYRTHLAAKYV